MKKSLTGTIVLVAAIAGFIFVTWMSIAHAKPSGVLPSFGSSWHYAGNVSLPGNIGNEICGVVRTPCANNPEFPAEKYVSNTNAIAYLVMTTLGETNSTGYVTTYETNLLIVNSHVYCIWTNRTDPRLALYNECPEVINSPQLPNTLNQNYKLTVSNQDYTVRYNLTNGAELKNMKVDIANKTLTLVVNSAMNGGELTLELPRQLIDAKFFPDSTPDCPAVASNTNRTDDNHCNSDVGFTINISNNSLSGSNQKVASTIENIPDARTLVIDYPKGTSDIQIQGTNIVPEFGFSTLALFVAIIGVIVANMAFKRMAKAP